MDLTMPSECPNHRLQELWHPLGVVGCITAFNFPMAVFAWNFCLAAVCGNLIYGSQVHTQMTVLKASKRFGIK